MTPNTAGRAIVGLILALAGSLTLASLVFLAYTHGPAAERMLFALGLAPAAAISALAQVGVLVGLYLLWTAARRR